MFVAISCMTYLMYASITRVHAADFHQVVTVAISDDLLLTPGNSMASTYSLASTIL